MNIKHLLFCICVVFVMGAYTGAAFAAEGHNPAEGQKPEEIQVPAAKELSAKAAAALITKPPAEGLIIIDVRTPSEFSGGHIEGAKNMDFFGPHLERQLLQLNRQTPVLIYCNSGNRSAGALDIMRQMGFTKVFHMTHGIQEWTTEGLPLVKGNK